MKHLIIKNSILLIFINVFLGSTLSMYSSVAQHTVPLDPCIRHGVLANGLTYYIKPTADESSKIDIRLIVKAGSAVLDPDQYELQHFMEHMAFKAGTNMTMAKANGLGFKIGEINGSTSFDFTKFYLKFINTKAKRDIAFQLLHDIIWDLDLKKEYINSERSVIINELAVRGRFRASSILNGLENSMIGRSPQTPKDIVKYIKTFPYEPLKRFYKDWYRPDLMAIVVVGDIEDVDKMEREIKTKFSKNKSVENPRPVNIDYSDYENLPPQFIMKEHPYLFKNSKKSAAYLRLYMRRKEIREETGLETLKNEQQRQLLIKLLGDRLSEKQNAYNTNFNVFPKSIFPSYLGLKLHLTFEKEKESEKEALVKTIQVIKQLQTNGFSKEEFNESKKKYLETLSKSGATKTPYWTSSILDHFVYGKILPQNKEALLKETICNLTLKEFNSFIKNYLNITPNGIDIIVLAPPGHRMLSYSEKTVRDWIAEANKLPVASYSKPKIPISLMDPVTVNNLKESSIKKKTSPLPGTTEYLLGNGVRVVLNSFDSTSIQNPKQLKKLSFHGFSTNGIRCYPKADYYSAMNSVEIVRNSGVGSLDKFDLDRYLTQKGFNGQISPYITFKEAGIRGAVSFEDLETALQLMYLHFTTPNKNHRAFEDWKHKASSSYALDRINKKDFKTSIRSVLRDSAFLPKGTKALKGISKTDFARALTIYREIYGNAEDFTFIFTGDFPENKVLSLCRKYLGNLPIRIVQKNCNPPTTSKKYTLPKPREISIPATEYMKEVKVQLVYVSKLKAKDLDWRGEAKSRLLHQLIKFSASQELRFNSDKGGTYYVGVGLNPEKSRLFNEVFVRFSCSPNDVNRLIKEVKQFVISFKNSTVDEELLERYKNMKVLYLEREKDSRNYISNKIYDYYKQGKPWHSVEEEQEYIKSLSPEDIRITAQRLLSMEPFEFKMVSDNSLR